MAGWIQFVSSASLFAFSLWLSLKILAPSSSLNKPALAVVVGFACTGASMAGGLFAFGFVMLGLLMILVQGYDLGLLKSFMVVVLMVAIQIGIGFLIDALNRPVVGLG